MSPIYISMYGRLHFCIHVVGLASFFVKRARVLASTQIYRYRGDILVSHFLATILKIELWLTPGFIDMVLVHRTNMFKISENHVITTYDVINEFRFIFVIR